jgi:hypothetical protein
MAAAFGPADSEQTSDVIVTSTHEASMTQLFHPRSSIRPAGTPIAR